MKERVYAVILAAGTASRMGELKQMLPIQGKPMLEKVIDNVLMEDFTEVITVIGHESDQIQKNIKIDDPRFSWSIHRDYQKGQSTSLKYGLEIIASQEASSYHVVVFLADLPFISHRTTRMIYEKGVDTAKSASTPFVIRPSYEGVKGHPVFFGHVKRISFHQLKGDEGGKPLMAHIQNKEVLPVKDEGIIADIDRREDYEKAIIRN